MTYRIDALGRYPERVEVTTVAHDEVVLFDGAELTTHDDLRPDTLYKFRGHEVVTLADLGEVLSTVATVNDVHFGETECGVISGTDIGPTFSVGPEEEPYPEMMNRGAIAEIAAMDADAVVVKGDLTCAGTLDEYRRFLEFYGSAFGDRLHHVRGNHDSYHGQVFADFAMQEVTVEGATLAILDTARDQQTTGSLSVDQLEWLDELASRVSTPVMVFGHHHAWNPDVDPRGDHFFGIHPDDSEGLFEVFARRTNLVGYFAGHTHRNRCQYIAAAGGAPFVEVACVKDFPGAVAEYRIFDGGVQQIFRRIAAPDAMAWSEKTRVMYEGGYGPYAMGRLGDRCFTVRAPSADRAGR